MSNIYLYTIVTIQLEIPRTWETTESLKVLLTLIYLMWKYSVITYKEPGSDETIMMRQSQ